MIGEGLTVYDSHSGSSLTGLVGSFENAHPGHAKRIDLRDRNSGSDCLKLHGAIGLKASFAVGLRGLSNNDSIGAADFGGVAC